MGIQYLLVLLVALLPAVSARAAPDFSDRLQLEKIHGPKEVKVIRAAGAREQFLSQGDSVFVGDEIQSAAGQIVELSAWDKSAWKIAPLSRLKIESRKPDRKSLFYWTMNLLQGGMWGKVTKDAKEKDGFRLKVKTRYSSMGIRGTEYLVSGNESLSSLDVIEGVVWWGKNVEFPPGSYKEVRAGQHAEMGPEGKVVLHGSKGDLAALAKAYGVVPGEDGIGPQEIHFTKEQCRDQGKGWKATDGSNMGECTSEGDKQ